jgi:CBS domain containing-hemolysin-like protein
LIDGAAPIHFVEESLEVHFPNRQDATTIGGYIVDLFRNIPPEGAIWVEDGWEVKVEKVDKFRVLQLHLRKTAPSLPQ